MVLPFYADKKMIVYNIDLNKKQEMITKCADNWYINLHIDRLN